MGEKLMRKKGWCFLPSHGRPRKGFDYRVGRTALSALGEATGNIVHRVWTDGDVGYYGVDLESSLMLSAPSIVTLYQYDATRALRRFISLCVADLLQEAKQYEKGCFAEQVLEFLELRQSLRMTQKHQYQHDWDSIRKPYVYYSLDELERLLTELSKSQVTRMNYTRSRNARALLEIISKAKRPFESYKSIWVAAYEASQVLPRDMTARLTNIITQNKPKLEGVLA